MGGEFVPIFYKESKLELIESGNFWLSETPSIPGILILIHLIIFCNETLFNIEAISV